jgi:hypothetical protein
MKRLLVTLIACFLVMSFLPQFAPGAEPGSLVAHDERLQPLEKQNLEKARARLGDKLLQSAEAVIARHLAAIGGILFPLLNMRVFDRLTPPHVFVIDEIKANEPFPDEFFAGN